MNNKKRDDFLPIKVGNVRWNIKVEYITRGLWMPGHWIVLAVNVSVA